MIVKRTVEVKVEKGKDFVRMMDAMRYERGWGRMNCEEDRNRERKKEKQRVSGREVRKVNSKQEWAENGEC